MSTATATRTRRNGTVSIPSIDARQIQRATEKFRLLSDFTRLRILAIITPAPRNVTDICEALGQSQPAVSHHLALLRVAGAIEADRRGKHNFYGLTAFGRTAVRAVAEMTAE